MIRFANPTALLLLLALPALYLMARPRASRAVRWALPLRLAMAAALALTLAGIQVTGPTREVNVLFLVDVSDSMPAQSREQAFEFIRQAAAALGPRDRAGVITFAGAPALEIPPTTGLAPTVPAARPQPAATDIGAAVQAALAVFPRSGHRRIVLLSDGHHNRGDLDGVVRLALAQGVEISAVPLGGVEGPDAWVDHVAAPTQVRAGEAFQVQAVIQATEAMPVRVRLLRDGRAVEERRVTARSGGAGVVFGQRALAEGLARYEVVVEAAGDVIPENNRGSAVTAMVGQPVVLLAGQEEGPLAAMLVSQGLRVVRRAGDALPSRAADLQGYDAVVLDDVPATVLSPAQMAALRDYVGTLGGGLVAIGGPQSFGIGGYAHTPLEQVLPVSMDVRHRLAIPSMAILLVIDASGSMGSFGNELAKVELAKETALAVVDLLGERDLIGVIAFDQEHRWLVPPIQARERQRILDQVSRLKAGGGTNMYPALEAAHTYLRRAAAKIKHVIALSDGQTDPGDFQRLVTAMARDQITVTSVAIGTDADVQLMRSISRWGQGRYYHAKDPYTVPQIFTAEALLASRAYLIEEPFIPRAAGDIPMLPGMRSLPQLRGYVATAPKAAADVHLVSHHDDPVLASWHYGLGRAVAFTSDARPRWAADWVRWRDGARAWSQMVRWAMRDAGGNLHLLSDVEGATGRLVLDARTPAGDLITDLDASARLVSPSGQAARVTLEQVAPGRYEAVIPLAETGAYAATVEARRDGRVVGARSAGLVASYSPEFRERGVNRPLLAHLVEVTGGRILSEPRQAAAPAPAGTRDHRDAWPWFAASAAALLVAEVAVRRVPALTQFVAEAAATVAGRLRGQPPAPAEAAEDHLYEEADRWRLGETEQASGIQVASMEHAARLYIARLKAMDESRRDPSDRSRSS